MKFVFIVLHYKAVESTKKCIDSILKLDNTQHSYSIIVVDNGSCDGTAEELAKKYGSGIDLIKLDEGIGFSRANNRGYEFAVEKYDPDIIVMTNNDIVFKQSEFLNKIYEISKRHSFDVLGPDIINPNGSHGNPYAKRPRNVAEIKKYIRNAKIKRALGILYCIFSDLKNKSNNNLESTKKNQTEQKNVCLWGSCLIFSKKFMERNDKAFFPETMFYCEEDILCHRVIKYGGLILYSPDIVVYHGHSDSTKAAFKGRLARNKFCFTNDIESGKIYLNMLEKEESIKS